MSAHTPRTFEVPAALVAAGHSPSVNLDALDRAVSFPGEFGDWAEKVLFTENAKTLQDVCGDARLLPRGILSSVQLDDGSLLVSGLVNNDGRVWDSQFNAWGTPSEPVDLERETVDLDDDEIAFVARALREGADEVWFRPYIPKAFVSAVVAAPPPPFDRQGKKAKQPEDPPVPQEIPPGSAIIAVVDPIDEDAVLEMLAITPGPHVLRRHDGNWFDDPEWVGVLKSVRPPKIVKLNEAQVASVASQVDRSTDNQDWEPFDAGSREQYQILSASVGRSPYLQELQSEADERALFALVAVAGRELTPKDVAATERLKRYWTVGKGAAKIRWGTPGSWRRCYRHLVKYVGPRVAPGYCTNLSKRLGGPGIATHVGDVKPIPGSSSVDLAYKSGDAWDSQGHRVVIDPEGIGETWYSHPDGSIGDPACLGSADSTVWVMDPSTDDEQWRVCPEHGDTCEDGAYSSVCQIGDCGWTNHYLGYGMHPLEAEGQSLVAANPTGENGYDNGMRFDERSVKRDNQGQFSPEGGSTRASRRSESVARTTGKWDESAAKFKIIDEDAEAEAKKRKKDADKAERERQREELARLSLAISEASAAGNTVKAAELRVQRAERMLAFADTRVEKLQAQTALNNARAALARARRAKTRAGSRSSGPSGAEIEAQRRENERVDALMKEFDEKFDN